MRFIPENGHKIKFKENQTFRLNVKRLIAFAYFPLPDILKGFDVLAD